MQSVLEATAAFSGGLSAADTFRVSGQGLADAAGTITAANEDYARRLLAALPDSLTRALHKTDLAVQFCYAVLLLPSRDIPLATIPGGRHAPDRLTIGGLQQELVRLGPAYNLPCLELAVAALRPLPVEERRAFIGNLETLAQSDGRVSLSELVITGFLKKHLNPAGTQAQAARYRRYEPVSAELRNLFGVMATLGAAEPDEQQALYNRTVATFLDDNPAGVPPAPGIKTLYLGLRKLNRLSPLLKQPVIIACGDCVSYDGNVSVREYELMRLVADQLDCPLPPLPLPMPLPLG